MKFSKTFPKTLPGTNYPVWEEIYLTEEEEREAEELCRKENFLLMDKCILEAKSLAIRSSFGIRFALFTIFKISLLRGWDTARRYNECKYLFPSKDLLKSSNL